MNNQGLRKAGFVVSRERDVILVPGVHDWLIWIMCGLTEYCSLLLRDKQELPFFHLKRRIVWLEDFTCRRRVERETWGYGIKAAYNTEPYFQVIYLNHIFSSLQLIDTLMKEIFSGDLIVAHIKLALKVWATKTSRYLLMMKSVIVDNSFSIWGHWLTESSSLESSVTKIGYVKEFKH